MHMAWLRHVAGRLESRYRYAIGLVYNTFPTPSPTKNMKVLEPLAQAVLDERAKHLDSTLGELYDPDRMPPALQKAHANLDRAVDRLYANRLFVSDRERAEHLFVLYEQMVAPLQAAINAKVRAKKPRANNPEPAT